MREIKKPKKMFLITDGKIKPVMAFENAIQARAYETAKSGVDGFIIYDGIIRAVKSSFDPQSRGYPGPWLHVFVRPLRSTRALRRVGISPQTQTRNYEPPTTRAAIERKLLADARDNLKRAKKEARSNIRRAAAELHKAAKIIAKGKKQ